MAKKSVLERDKKRRRLVKKYAEKRAALKKAASDPASTPKERYLAFLALASLPRNSSPSRVRNRCSVSGRGRAFYRKFGISRIALRELGGSGLIPGLVKSSW